LILTSGCWVCMFHVLIDQTRSHATPWLWRRTIKYRSSFFEAFPQAAKNIPTVR
jgi:hypothetical protein